MRKLLLMAISSITLAACQANNAAEIGERDAIQQEEGGRVLLSNKNNLYEQRPMTNRNDVSTTEFGYSRKQKNSITTGDHTDQIAYINRNTLADIITDLEIRLRDVTDAATFVTDDEVFVVYRANTTDPKLVADQVQKTALSVVPRYYHVYVSTNTKLMTQIEGLKSGTLNDKESAQTINMLINEMKNNPHLNNQQDDSLDNMIMK